MQNSRRSALKSILGGVVLASALRPGPAAGAGASAKVPGDCAAVIWRTGEAAILDQRAYNLRTARAPRYRALCMAEEGVVRAVDWARQNRVPFSVLSGGHCFEGLSQSPHLVIDLRHLNRITAGAGDIMRVGPGATLGDVNAATGATDRALPAGYCQTVGIGGHIGGGGLGILSRAFGLASDHLISARVLTADGNITNASTEQNPDLFWALRGGGSGSFGIVTSSQFRLRPVARAALVEMFWILSVSDAAKLLADLPEFSAALDRRVSCFLYLKAHKPGHILIRCKLVSVGGPAITTQATNSLSALAPTLTEPNTVEGRFLDIADLMWPRKFNPKLHTKLASGLLGQEMPGTAWLETLTRFAEHRQSDQRLGIEILGGAIDDMAPQDTAYVHRGNAMYLLQFGVSLPSGSDIAARIAAMRDVQNGLAPALTGGAYVNYPDRDLPDWPAAYWGANYSRPVQVKNQFDPQDVFRHAQSVRL